MSLKGPASTFEAVDWDHWQADEVATLLFLVERDRILLIRKKRGLGAGKITAPGGRQEPGESLEACARRELHEEVGLSAKGPLFEVGELSFEFTSGYKLHVHVFTTDTVEGQAHETEEALPLYFPTDQIPYEEMWADDSLWMPWVLNGSRFRGQFLFEKDQMLGHRVWKL